MNEWSDEYSQASAPPALAPLKPELQIGDYAVWQRRAFDARKTARDLEFWKRYMQDAPTEIALPSFRQRPRIQRHQGAAHFCEIPRGLVDEVVRFARLRGVTPFTVWMCGLSLVLERYTGQNDFLLGTPFANRKLPGTERIVGLLANTVVVRLRTSRESSFASLVAAQSQSTIAAFDHADCPFEEIVKALEIVPRLDRNPLFQVFFSHLGVTLDSWRFGSAQWRRLPMASGGSKFDLSVDLEHTDATMRAGFEYDVDLFEKPLIEQMAGDYLAVLQSALMQPEQPLALVDETAFPPRVAIPAHWTSHVIPKSRRTVAAAIAEASQRNPQRVAVICGPHEITYEDLEQRASELSGCLSARSIGKGELVALCVGRSVDLIVGLLGILKSGAAYLPLDPRLPLQRIMDLVHDSQVVCLIGDETNLERLESADVPCINVAMHGSAARTTAEEPSRDDLAYVIYTSGTTGRPKGVEVPHGALINVVESVADRLRFAPTDVWLAVTSIGFDIAALELLLPLACGGRVVIADEAQAVDPRLLAPLIDTSHATVVQTTPGRWQMLLDSGWSGRAGLKLLSGGEALSRELANGLCQCSSELWNVYGPTETTIWSTMTRIRAGQEPVSIGSPLSNTLLEVFDETMRPTPVGVLGELYIGGRGLARGYRRQPALTAECFIPHPRPTAEASRLYRTGDLVRLRHDGGLEFHGRRDRQIKWGGSRIEPAEIEAVLLDDAQVGAAFVCIRPSPGGQQLVAYVLLCTGNLEGSVADELRLRERVRRRLPEQLVPQRIGFVRSFPLSVNGKLDVDALAATALFPGDAAVAAPMDRSPPQQAVAELWMQLLGTSHFRDDTNFFDAGGSSLMLARLQVLLKERLGVELSLVELFEHNTIRAIADRLRNIRTTTQPTRTNAESRSTHRLNLAEKRRTARRQSKAES